MTINKFNVAWQLARVQARAIKDVKKKLNFVLLYLAQNNTQQDKGRVLNWLKMTKVAYKDTDTRFLFDEYIDMAEMVKVSDNDNKSKMSDMSKQELELIYKDLKTRKYGFQFKSVPKAHTEFMKDLEAEIERRK